MLIGIAVATSAGAYLWILSTQGQIERHTRDRVTSGLDSLEYIINDITCSSETSNITILLYNSGQDKIDQLESWIYLKNKTDGTIINSSQGPIITIEKDSTNSIWPNDLIGMSLNQEYRVRITVGGEIKEVDCTTQ